MNDNLDNPWLIDNDDSTEESVYICGWCGSDIYAGDTYYDFDGERVCEDCVNDCKKEA